MTITIPLWLPIVYVAIGAVLWLPMEYIVWRSLYNPEPFWTGLANGIRRRPWAPLLVVIVWPRIIHEAIWPKLRKLYRKVV